MLASSLSRCQECPQDVKNMECDIKWEVTGNVVEPQWQDKSLKSEFLNVAKKDKINSGIVNEFIIII